MEADRISLLPDKILHHILSFIDTQMVIETTLLLSKRWANLWLSIPTLIFDFSSFSCPHLDHRETCFRRFIEQVLSHRRKHLTPLSRVNKITLCFVSEPLGSDNSSEELEYCRTYETEDRVLFKRLFNFAAQNHVQDLSINGAFLDLSLWCRRFKTCQSLKLSGYFDSIWVPYSFEFLKSLEIENFYAPFYFELEEGMFPNYPLLERLILRGSCFEHVYISAPKLEYLELGTLTCDDDMFSPEIFLCTPKLAFVNIDTIVPNLRFTDDFPSLQKVEFNLSYDMPIPYEGEVRKQVVDNLRSVLNLFQKANSITLDSVAVEVLSEYIDPSSMEDDGVTFRNLRHLRLSGKVKKPNHILSCLQNSPSLETWHHEELW